MTFFLVVLAVFILLVLNELWWRRYRPKSELSRKFIHITVGSFVAFWPYLLSWNQIRLLSLGFLLVVAFSRYWQIFRAIHSVHRLTLGEFFFALAVGLLSFVQHHPHIYTAALLVMSLADGLAAVLGTRFGKQSRYRVFGATKSVVGTLTFLVVANAILAIYSHTSQLLPAWEVGLVALGATLLENIGAYGSDNLSVPLFVGAILLFL